MCSAWNLHLLSPFLHSLWGFLQHSWRRWAAHCRLPVFCSYCGHIVGHCRRCSGNLFGQTIFTWWVSKISCCGWLRLYPCQGKLNLKGILGVSFEPHILKWNYGLKWLVWWIPFFAGLVEGFTGDLFCLFFFRWGLILGALTDDLKDCNWYIRLINERRSK